MNSVIIRNGERGDIPRVFELIQELALFERAPNEVTNTVEEMVRDGFGPSPLYGFFVAVDQSGIIGTSIYYYRYSTWKGKRLYLEDIIVTENKRGLGIGKILFEETVRKALSENCSGMLWQVLEWNEAAIRFYLKYDAKIDGEWRNCSLESDKMTALVGLFR